MAIANALRVPSQSVNHPATSMLRAYPHLKEAAMYPYVTVSQPIIFARSTYRNPRIPLSMYANTVAKKSSAQRTQRKREAAGRLMTVDIRATIVPAFRRPPPRATIGLRLAL